MTVAIELHWKVRAPAPRIFDLARSVDAHVASTEGTREEAVGGKTSGLLDLGDEVTWRARHLGVVQELTTRMTRLERPHYFRDSMIRGAFHSFDHDHWFAPGADGITACRDLFTFTAPLGPLGWIAERAFLERYMRAFLVERNRVLKELAERDP